MIFCQERCYNTPLLPQAMDEVRNCIARHLPQGVRENGITLEGELLVHVACLHLCTFKEGRFQWSISKTLWGGSISLRFSPFLPGTLAKSLKFVRIFCLSL